MTAEEMNDWYYSARCTGCGCLWFHEPHKAGCSTKAHLDILNDIVDNIEMQVRVPLNGDKNRDNRVPDDGQMGSYPTDN